MHQDSDLTLAEVLAPVRRRAAFIVAGTVLSWVALLAAIYMVPASYRSEATLLFPDTTNQRAVTASGDVRPPNRPGVSLVVYKKIERSLTDRAAVTANLDGKLEAATLERIPNLASSVSPITTAAIDDVTRLGSGDMITGVRIVVSGSSDEEATRLAAAISDLVKQVLLTEITLEEIEHAMNESSTEREAAAAEKVRLTRVNHSLELVAVDIQRLVRQPVTGSSGTREVVDVREGGHRFLSPGSQIVGIRAEQAENAHAIRLAEELMSRHDLRLRFGRTITDAMSPQFGGSRRYIADLPQFVWKTFNKFLEGQSPDPVARQYLTTDIETLVGRLESFQSRTRLIQSPTVTRQSRAPLAAATAAFLFIFVVAVAVAFDFWARRRPA